MFNILTGRKGANDTQTHNIPGKHKHTNTHTLIYTLCICY